MRPEDRDAAYIWDILEAAREVREFVAGMRFHDYQQDRMAQAAERIPELVRQLEPLLPPLPAE